MRIKGLETTIKQTIYDFKERKNYLETLNNDIISLKKDIEKKDRQIKTYNEVINSKNNRLLQLDQILKGSAKIFADQAKFTATLRDKLSKEKSATGISIEYNRHLEKDIKRLDEEKQELETRIKELENLDEDSKKLRDQELAELRTKLNTLAKSFQEAQDIDQQIYDILGQQSQQKGLLLRSQEVIQKINHLTAERDNRPTQQQLTNLQNQLTSTRQQLQKELSWWDKWINSSLAIDSFVRLDFEDFILFQSQDECNYLKGRFNDNYNRAMINHNGYRRRIEYFGKRDEYDKYDKNQGLNSIKELKRAIKAISEYYKNK